MTRVGPSELVGSPVGDGTGQIDRPAKHAIVVDDDDAVAREAGVELQTVGATRQPRVERGDCVFRRERAPAAVGEDQRPSADEEGMTHAQSDT